MSQICNKLQQFFNEDANTAYYPCELQQLFNEDANTAYYRCDYVIDNYIWY